LQTQNGSGTVKSIPMKQFIVVLGCLSIFYAGAVWALEGCSDFESGVHAAHHSETSSHNHHNAGEGSHHSHTDPSKIHCPNLLGEFLISSRAILSSNNSHVLHIAHDAWAATGALLFDSAESSEGDGPPGYIHSRMFPRHLLLSVIRI
jgi:hypothetical protein